MEIKTLLDIYDECYFLMCDRINKAIIQEVWIKKTRNEINVTYIIDKNPCGTSYTITLSSNDVFATKQELLNSL